STRRSAEVFYCHPQPPRPLMVGVVSPHIQPVRNPLLVHDAPELSILVHTDVPLPCGEHDFHLPVAAEKPLITHIRQVVGRAIEITIIVIIPVEKLVDVESPAHAHAMRNHVGMLERKVHGMISAETAAGHRNLMRLSFSTNEGQKLLQDIPLVLQMTQNSYSPIHALA